MAVGDAVVSLSDVPTMGVEEEFFLIDPVTRTPQPRAADVIAAVGHEAADLVSGEFTRHQIEVRTPPCGDADQLRAELARVRAATNTAAASVGLRLCAAGTPVLTDRRAVEVGDHPRYRAGTAQYRAMLDDFALCSMHVHVHIPDRELALRVGNHLRPWLPTLLVLSANSRFCRGADTGYSDWRAVVRSRFPCLGPPPYASSLRQYEELSAAITESGAMLKADLPFWDVRPNPVWPTVEIRTMDVAADLDDTVALGTIVRALVTTVARAAGAGDPGPMLSSELLRAAYWRAARDGWSGCVPDAATGRLVPSPEQAARLIDHIEAALVAGGDTEAVSAFMDRLSARGNGADLQRASASRHGDLTGVVDDLLDLTART
ncbi:MULTISPECIES: glutamate--cysteine ligase [unclassified Mycobacterium]|uniref:carboxylate-amine ligase n=1 Tax=unclassified Mycobacterium TaxID=2642494 RepID=UPI00073FAA0D|nr:MULTISPECIES: glutamate--cysteine ligase [unclassified Mycobacterium]KUH81174.1 carboxylate--amine ligase [Mycobacterium sp. GA-1999]KUH88112.1 carboxylate--amine ligase [Mycobacterium sp. IS-1556]KUH90049.1 carboxylate--amine ligase [Mycobacterium sp. GA-0227b]